MKRKINLVGQNTLTVSLPSKWAKEHNLKKGDELDLVENGKDLILTTGSSHNVNQIQINLSELGAMIHRVIGATYKAGYDHIFIKYANADELKTIISEVERACPNFDINHKLNNVVELKSLAHLDEGEFKIIFRKITFLIIDIADELCKNYKEKKPASSNEILVMKDRLIDKYSNFCRRLLNKDTQTDFHRAKCVYSILEDLEIVGDYYKDLCKLIIKYDSYPSESLINLLSDINLFVESVSEVLFNPGNASIRQFNDCYAKLQIIFDKSFNYKSKLDIESYFLLKYLFQTIFDIKSALFSEVVDRIK